MIAPMAQTQNLPQHRTIMRMPPGGSSFHSSSLAPSHSDSPIGSYANSLGEADYSSNSQLQTPFGKSPSRWPVPVTSSDLPIASRWPTNSIESSGHCGSPSLDTFNAAFSELFDSTMRINDAQQHQQQQFMDGGARYGPSVASLLSVGTSGLSRTLSAPLGGALGSTSPRLCESWTSTADRGSNLGLTVDPSKGGLSLQGAGRGPSTSSLPRFSANPGFAERAARFSAFGNGQFTPSFPLTENGNVGRSACFENNSSKRAKVSNNASRPVSCSSDGTDRSPLSRSNASEGRGADSGREDRNSRAEPKASGSKSFTTSACAQGDQDDAGKSRNAADEADLVSSDSDGDEDDGRQQEESCSDQEAKELVLTNSTGKKRKTSADEPAKDVAGSSSKDQKGSKRSKDGEGGAEKDEQRAKSDCGSENSELSNSPAPKESSKAAEQPKSPKLDYIHVRARRGQATDSHSLAERVRREKISERMKYLQDLVPGCSKVTGKAVMLDEIINYVQSIQRQVEFLSMKLAAVTPRPDFSIDNILNKQLQIRNSYGLPNMVEHSNSGPSFAHIQSQQPLHMQHGLSHTLEIQSQQPLHTQHGISRSLEIQAQQPLHTHHGLSHSLEIQSQQPRHTQHGVTRSLEIQPQPSLHSQHGVTHSLDYQPPEMNIRRMNSNPMAFAHLSNDNTVPFSRTPAETFDVGQAQTSGPWDGDLQSVVQMGFGQSMQGYGLSGLQCDLPSGHMKMEL